MQRNKIHFLGTVNVWPKQTEIAIPKSNCSCEHLAKNKNGCWSSEKPINTPMNPIWHISPKGVLTHVSSREAPPRWRKHQKENNHISWSVIDCACMSPLHSDPHTSSSRDTVHISLSITTVTKARASKIVHLHKDRRVTALLTWVTGQLKFLNSVPRLSPREGSGDQLDSQVYLNTGSSWSEYRFPPKQDQKQTELKCRIQCLFVFS